MERWLLGKLLGFVALEIAPRAGVTRHDISNLHTENVHTYRCARVIRRSGRSSLSRH